MSVHTVSFIATECAACRKKFHKNEDAAILTYSGRRIQGAPYALHRSCLKKIESSDILQRNRNLFLIEKYPEILADSTPDGAA